MMKNEPEFGLVESIKHKKTEEKDGLTWGQLIDESPAWTH